MEAADGVTREWTPPPLRVLSFTARGPGRPSEAWVQVCGILFLRRHRSEVPHKSIPLRPQSLLTRSLTYEWIEQRRRAARDLVPRPKGTPAGSAASSIPRLTELLSLRRLHSPRYQTVAVAAGETLEAAGHPDVAENGPEVRHKRPPDPGQPGRQAQRS